MTRKDYFRFAKLFGLSLLVSVPCLVALDLLVGAHLSQIALIAIDVALILAGFVVAMVVDEKHKKHIAQKRQEFLEAHNAEKQNQQQNSQNIVSTKSKKHHKKRKH